MLPIFGMVLYFFCKDRIRFLIEDYGFLIFDFFSSDRSVSAIKNQNFTLYLQINGSEELLVKIELDIE